MSSLIIPIFRDPVPYQGALGLFATLTIERLNGFVGLLVGLATLVYLCLRILGELRSRADPPPHFISRSHPVRPRRPSTPRRQASASS